MREDLMAGQYLFATLVLGVIVFARYRQALKVKQVLKLFLVGVFGFACSFCMYETVAITSTAFAVTMLFQYVWLGILFDCIVSRKLPTRPIVIAMLLVVAGTPFATGIFESSSSVSVPGLLWGLGAAATYVGMLWTSARLETKLPSVTRTFNFSIAQTILAVIVSQKFFFTVVEDPNVLMYVIPISLVSVVIPCLLIMKGAPQVPMGITTIMTGLELPAVILLGSLFLGEMHSFSVICGVVLICAGIVAANWTAIVELRERSKAKV